MHLPVFRAEAPLDPIEIMEGFETTWKTAILDWFNGIFHNLAKFSAKIARII